MRSPQETLYSMKSITTILILLVFLPLQVLSQTAEDPAPEKALSSFALALNQDNAFGFYPAVYGSFGLNQKTSFTFYSIFWTNPQFGTPETGTDLWTEFGVGLGFSLWKDQISLQPAIGLTNGRLLSGKADGVASEGVVASLTTFYYGKRLELEAFLSYYRSISREDFAFNDYTLYWAYPGVIISDNISVGLHVESFDLVGSGFDVITGPLYSWWGGYAKFTINDKYSLRFSTGKNTRKASAYAGDFYKVSAFIAFE